MRSFSSSSSRSAILFFLSTSAASLSCYSFASLSLKAVSCSSFIFSISFSRSSYHFFNSASLASRYLCYSSYCSFKSFSLWACILWYSASRSSFFFSFQYLQLQAPPTPFQFILLTQLLFKLAFSQFQLHVQPSVFFVRLRLILFLFSILHDVLYALLLIRFNVFLLLKLMVLKYLAQTLIRFRKKLNQSIQLVVLSLLIIVLVLLFYVKIRPFHRIQRNQSLHQHYGQLCVE